MVNHGDTWWYDVNLCHTKPLSPMDCGMTPLIDWWSCPPSDSYHQPGGSSSRNLAPLHRSFEGYNHGRSEIPIFDGKSMSITNITNYLFLNWAGMVYSYGSAIDNLHSSQMIWKFHPTLEPNHKTMTNITKTTPCSAGGFDWPRKKKKNVKLGTHPKQ